MNAPLAIKPATRRCAIYTRKSSEEGLEQAFNSLHAQRAACEAYVLSQAGEGWTASPDIYDDGGVSGGTMEREGLKRLLAEVAAGGVDVVVVYKVDRLTRSLADFARIVEAFDKAAVSFVSVTQAFNTTSSMGRLTLNVLLSFAQFEREVTGERIRDKIALSKAKGLWMGGVLPLGCDTRDHRLVVNPAEAETVRHIFRRYLALGSVHDLCRELEVEGLHSRAWTSSKGRAMGGAVFGRGALFHLLANRHYLGDIVHKEKTYPAMHEPIVPPELFEAVKVQLKANRVRKRGGAVKVAPALLGGRVFDGEGRRFSPTFSTGRSGRIHRYYVLSDLQLGRAAPSHSDAIRRVSAPALERLVVEEVRRLADSPHTGLATLLALVLRIELRPAETHLILDQAKLFGDDHPVLALDDLRGRLGSGERLVGEPGDPPTLRIALPRRMQLRGGRTWSISTPPGPTTAGRPDPILVDALKRAHLVAGRSTDAAPTSQYERRLTALAFLAPDLQRAILEGRQPAGLSARQSPSWRKPD